MKNLIEKYSTLYANIARIECGPGWYNLLDELSAKLEPLGVRARQVKEKFGGLRFYVEQGAPEEALLFIEQAEALSLDVCEECGAPGALVGTMYVRTVCGRHAEPEEVVHTIRALRSRLHQRDVIIDNAYRALNGED